MTAYRIESGTPDGDALGFVESLYSGWLEIKGNHRIYLHFIISRYKNEGNTQTLIRRWIAQGYDVRVVMPRPIMQHILQKLHFVRAEESLPEWYEETVECWRQPVAERTARMSEEKDPAGENTDRRIPDPDEENDKM